MGIPVGYTVATSAVCNSHLYLYNMSEQQMNYLLTRIFVSSYKPVENFTRSYGGTTAGRLLMSRAEH